MTRTQSHFFPFAEVAGLFVCLTQFIDYAKAPLVETLTLNPHASKIYVFLEAVGFTNTHSGRYVPFRWTNYTDSRWRHVRLLLDHAARTYLVRRDGVKVQVTLPLLIDCVALKLTRTGRMITVDFSREDADRFSKLVEYGMFNAAARFPPSHSRFVGKVRPVIGSAVSFSDALKAYNRIWTARTVGEGFG